MHEQGQPAVSSVQRLTYGLRLGLQAAPAAIQTCRPIRGWDEAGTAPQRRAAMDVDRYRRAQAGPIDVSNGSGGSRTASTASPSDTRRSLMLGELGILPVG
jgi:hypothetical protein